MAGDRQRVRDALDATQAALADASRAFDEEYPAGPTEPVPGPIVRVPVGGDVQAALDDARSTGATLLLAVGEHRVNLVVHEDPLALPVLITSDTTTLPAAGQRMTRDYLPGLAQLKSANNMDPVIAYRCKSSGVHLTGLATAPLQYDRTVISFGTDDMTTPEEQPHDVVHDRLLMLGDPVRGQHRGVMAHARRYSLINSSVLDFHEQGRDSQALCAWNGGQDLTIRNCHLNAGAENIMFGGGSARTDAMAPRRILIEDCLLDKNPDWVDGMQYPPTVKCLLEVKHARQIQIRRNVFQHCWPEAWGSGVAIVFKSCDQTGNEPWTLTEDVVFEHNVIRRVGQGFSIVGSHDSGRTSQLMRNVRIAHNLLYDVDTDEWQGKGALVTVSNMPTDFVLDHLTCIGNGWGVMEYGYNQPARGTGFTCTNSALYQGNYGIKGSSGMTPSAWATDMGYAPTVSGLGLRNDPDRHINFGPGNVECSEADWDASLDARYAVVPGSALANVATTDGQMIGCDIERLPASWKRRHPRQWPERGDDA